MNTPLRFLFFQCLVRPIVSVVLGLNVRHRERLPDSGPTIIAANHNSHLDTMVMMTLFPWRVQRRVRPLAAADYFLGNPVVAWFSRRIIGIVPLDRSGDAPRESLFDGATSVLRNGDLLLLFPEGSRGEPERLSAFRSGLYHLCAENPEASIVPVFLHGLGKSLPRGEALLVPFFCDVFIGEPLRFDPDKRVFMERVTDSMASLAREGSFPAWE